MVTGTQQEKQQGKSHRDQKKPLLFSHRENINREHNREILNRKTQQGNIFSQNWFVTGEQQGNNRGFFLKN